MAATKEAVIAKEHHPELDIHIFQMDMRAFSKGYWDYFKRARDQYGVHYHHCRISGIQEDPDTQKPDPPTYYEYGSFNRYPPGKL